LQAGGSRGAPQPRPLGEAAPGGQQEIVDQDQLMAGSQAETIFRDVAQPNGRAGEKILPASPEDLHVSGNRGSQAADGLYLAFRSLKKCIFDFSRSQLDPGILATQ
jgi:hypothetical protein